MCNVIVWLNQANFRRQVLLLCLSLFVAMTKIPKVRWLINNRSRGWESKIKGLQILSQGRACSFPAPPCSAPMIQSPPKDPTSHYHHLREYDFDTQLFFCFFFFCGGEDTNIQIMAFSSSVNLVMSISVKITQPLQDLLYPSLKWGLMIPKFF